MSGVVGANSARGRKRGAAIGLSLLAHLIVLSLIALNVPGLVLRETPVQATNIWLMPHLTPRSRTVKARPEAASAAAAPMAPRKTKPRPAPPSPIQAAPAQPSPSAAPPAAAGPPAPGETGAGVLGALRSGIGCDIGSAAHLTPEEKDRCNRLVGEAAHKGPKFIDTIPPEKRAYYDAVQQAYQASRDPEHPQYRDANGNIQTWGHPPAVGCSFKGHFKPGASLSDKIKATGMIGVPIGPLSCGLALPQGSMTPELGIPTP